MPSHDPTLHLVCGKIAAGKSTLAQRLASAPAEGFDVIVYNDPSPDGANI